MSKMDDLSAMRQARYERTVARTAAAGPRPRAAAPVAPPAEAAKTGKPARTTKAPKTAAAAAPGAEALCGHRNMGGRSCTRELGHTAKSHRYS